MLDRSEMLARFGETAADVWTAGIASLELDATERAAVLAAREGRGDVRIVVRFGTVLEVAADVIEGERVTRVFRLEAPPGYAQN
jgi:hypothetical protein